MTIEQAGEAYLLQVQANGRSPLTLDVYRREVGWFVEWVGSGCAVEKIDSSVLAKYLTQPEMGRRHARTVNRTRTVLRGLFAYLHDTGVIPNNPARVLKQARLDPPLPRALSQNEEARFRAVLAKLPDTRVGRRDRLLFTLLLETGMRIGAALDIRVEDIEWDAGVIRSTGKHGRVQRIELTPAATEALRGYLENEGVASGPIFRSGGVTKLSTRQAHDRFRRLRETAGLSESSTVHSLRHSFASRVLIRSGDIRTVRARLGHRSIIATLPYLESSPCAS